MDEIRKDEILPRDEYECARPELRWRIMVLKDRRRIQLGAHATLHFETRETMLYQVHEMLRAEGSWERPGAIEAELAAYNPIVPSGRELSATLMLEYEDPAERAVRLQELLGLDAHLRLHVGQEAPARVAGRAGCRHPRRGGPRVVSPRARAEPSPDRARAPCGSRAWRPPRGQSAPVPATGAETRCGKPSSR